MTEYKTTTARWGWPARRPDEDAADPEAPDPVVPEDDGRGEWSPCGSAAAECALFWFWKRAAAAEPLAAMRAAHVREVDEEEARLLRILRVCQGCYGTGKEG